MIKHIVKQATVVALCLLSVSICFGQNKRATLSYYQDKISFNELPRSITIDGNIYDFNNMQYYGSENIGYTSLYKGKCSQIEGDIFLIFDNELKTLCCHYASTQYGKKIGDKIFEVPFKDVRAKKESANTDSLYNNFLNYHYKMYKIKFHKEPVSRIKIASCATYKYSKEFENYQLIETLYDTNYLIIDYQSKLVKVTNPLGAGYVLNNRAKIINVLPKQLTLKAKEFYENDIQLELIYDDSKLREGWLTMQSIHGNSAEIYVGDYLHKIILYFPESNDFAFDYIRDEHDFSVSLYHITNLLWNQ